MKKTTVETVKTVEIINKVLRHTTSIRRGASIAAAGAILTYLSEFVAGHDFGEWTPLVTAFFSILTNIVRKLAVRNK